MSLTAKPQVTETSQPDAQEQWWAMMCRLLGGMLVRPTATLREFRQAPIFFEGLLLVVFLAVLEFSTNALAVLLGVRPADSTVASIGSGREFAELSLLDQLGVVFGLLSGLLQQPLFWVIGSTVVYGITLILGGRGPYTTFLGATGLAVLPLLLLAPFRMFVDMLSLINTPFAISGWLMLAPFRLAAAVWLLALIVIVVREVMNVSTPRAFVATFCPILIVGFLMIVAIMWLFAFVFGVAGLAL